MPTPMAYLWRLRQRLAHRWLEAYGPPPSASWEQHVVARFCDSEVGQAYGLDRRRKRELVDRFKTAAATIPSGTSWLYHVVLASEIVALPPATQGAVVECGCWKGASTSSLSLICEATGRELIVCDSFQGLPDDEPNVVHDYPHVGVYGYYQKGMYCGRLDEVRANVGRCGALKVCRFVPGFFSDTLVALKEPVAFAFLDVDLASSLRDCIQHLWPLLVDGGRVYTDDSCDMECIRVWFDKAWWQEKLGEREPGYVGSGCGLPVTPAFSSLGYARKVRDVAHAYHRVEWLTYPDAVPAGPMFTGTK